MGWGGSENGEEKHLQELGVTARRTNEWNDKKDKEMHYKITFEESGGGACYGDSGNYFRFLSKTFTKF